MFAAQFAHLEQTKGTKADSAEAAARRALRRSTEHDGTIRPARIAFAARIKGLTPHFGRGRAQRHNPHRA